jgi:hypothetical protein
MEITRQQICSVTDFGTISYIVGRFCQINERTTGKELFFKIALKIIAFVVDILFVVLPALFFFPYGFIALLAETTFFLARHVIPLTAVRAGVITQPSAPPLAPAPATTYTPTPPRPSIDRPSIQTMIPVFDPVIERIASEPYGFLQGINGFLYERQRMLKIRPESEMLFEPAPDLFPLNSTAVQCCSCRLRNETRLQLENPTIQLLTRLHEKKDELITIVSVGPGGCYVYCVVCRLRPVGYGYVECSGACA